MCFLNSQENFDPSPVYWMDQYFLKKFLGSSLKNIVLLMHLKIEGQAI